MKAIDAYTGAALSGVSLSLAGRTYTTDSDGNATATFELPTENVQGESIVSMDGYAVAFFQNVNLDLSADASIVMPLAPSDTSAYELKDLSVRIREFAGAETATSSELPAGRSFTLRVNKRDGSGWEEDFVYATGGLSVSTPCFGNDCMVSIVVDNWTTPGDSFVWHAGEMDLSGAGPIAVDITESVDPADYQEVSLLWVTALSSTHAFLRTPYGGSVPAYANTSMDAGTETVRIFNPDDYTHAFWHVSRVELDEPAPGQGRTLEVSTDFLPLSGTVGLFTLDLNVETAQYPAGNLFSYDSASGTLSSNLLEEGDEHAILGYTVVFTDPVTGDRLGQGGFSGDSYVLPAALRTRLAGNTVRVFGVLRKDAVANLYYEATRDMPFVGNECPVRNQCLVWPTAVPYLYFQDITF